MEISVLSKIILLNELKNPPNKKGRTFFSDVFSFNNLSILILFPD
jgi:hypothetical protein